MIYNTFWFGAPSITPETFTRLTDAEHVVAVKWDAPSDEEFDRMQEFASDFNVINNSLKYVYCHQLGGRGNISASAHANAAHDFKFWQLLENHKYDQAQTYIDEFLNTVWIPWTDASGKKSGGYRLLKAFMYANGKPVGQPRLPTLPIEDYEIEDLKERLRKVGWAVVD